MPITLDIENEVEGQVAGPADVPFVADPPAVAVVEPVTSTPPADPTKVNGQHSPTVDAKLPLSAWVRIDSALYDSDDFQFLSLAVVNHRQLPASSPFREVFVHFSQAIKDGIEAKHPGKVVWDIADELPCQIQCAPPINTEPLCEQPDCENSATVVVGAATAADTITDPPKITDVEIGELARRNMKLQSAESRLLECSLEIYEAELSLESAKDRLKTLRETHSEMASEVQRMRSGQSGHVVSPAPQANNPTPQGTDAADLPAVLSASNDSAPAAVGSIDSATPIADWRSIPTIRVCSEPTSIKGLGAGKLATLAERYPDLGSLEDARAKAGDAGIHTVLPNGCGKGLGEMLTERIIHWLTKTRDAAAFEELTGKTPEPVGSPLPAGLTSTACPAGIAINDPSATGMLSDGRPVEIPAEPAATATATESELAKKKGRPKKGGGATIQKELPAASEAVAAPIGGSTYPTFAQWEAMSDAARSEWILARAAALNTGEANCLDQKMAVKGYWDSGYQANGHPEFPTITECQYVPGPEQDEWLRGWMAKDAVEAYEGKRGEAKPVPAAAAPATAATAAPTLPPLMSLDDL